MLNVDYHKHRSAIEIIRNRVLPNEEASQFNAIQSLYVHTYMCFTNVKYNHYNEIIFLYILHKLSFHR
jgi:hypothetical protein